MSAIVDGDRAAAEAALAERKASAPEPIDDASLPAGSPMHYYCQGCGHPTATLPEGWYETPPPRFCAPCQTMVERGWLDG